MQKRALDLTGYARDEDLREYEVHREPDGGLYDLILTRIWLSRHEQTEALERLRGLADMLADGGQLHLLEPSPEFAAREILAGRVVPPLWMHLYGTGDAPLRSAYTMSMLRGMVERVGLVVPHAVTRPYDVARSEDEAIYRADMHYVVGVKWEGQRGWLSMS